MAETALISPQKPSAADSETALFHRRIEFHVAKRPFNGFSNNGTSNGFKLVTLNPNCDTHYTSSSSSGQKLDKSNLSDNAFDPELSFQITFRRIGAGLRNLGNTCFLNSVLQCLTYTEPLAAYLQSGKHQSSCRTAGFCALCAIQKHVSRALQSTGRILEPKDLVSNLRCISRSFRNARQEDAHEYMVNLLESMHKCCLPSGVPSESASAYERSLVHKIFGGRLRSQVKCMQCSFCSNKFDPFLDLSLEIHKADSVLKALAHFTAKEQLDGGAKQYQCQQCKQKVRALKQLTIHKAPHVLTVHLKRFGSHVPRQKIDKKIAFDRTLDLKPFVTGPYDGDLKYTLYGVLVHAGWSTHSGHYYCFVRTSSGMWYSLDDNQVVQVSEKKAMEQKAYMLFYVRDRKNIVTKKPVDIIQKENMVMHAIENTASSKFNLEFKGKIQNCSVEKKVDGSFSGAISEREASVVTVPKEIPSDKVLVHNVNGRIAAENSSVVPPMKDSKKDASINLLGHKVESHSSQGNVYANLPQDSLHKNGSIPSVCYNDRANGNPSGVAEQPPPDRSVLCTSNGGTCKINSTNPETCDSKTIPSLTVGAASNEVNKVKSSKQNRTEKDLVGGSLPMGCGSTIGETWENKRGMEDVQSKIPAATHLSCGVANKRPRLNFKRKLFKCQIATMLLSSYIIFGQPRKKMHKNRKRVSLQNKSLNGKNSLVDNELPLTLGQSVSEKSSHVPIEHCTPSKKKKVKRGAANEGQSLPMANINGNGNISSDASNEEFKERILNLSAEMEPQRRQSANEGPGNYKNYARESRQNDLMSMLTRGVEETTVARWDGIDVSPKENLEPRTAGTAQIGYIGDEWDEEYDRGKRKKIRESKSSFGGPNPFQEIAAKKCGRKRAKLDRASSAANQPFRIL